jgi:ribonuclease Z
MIDITLLGTGGGMPMPNRFLSSMTINYQGEKLLIDCGEGTQVAMRMVKTGFKAISTICITHVHGDHIFGLPGLLSTIGNSNRTEPITIIGPKGIWKVLEGLLVSLPYLPYEINILEAPTYLKSDNLEIRTTELDHSAPCLGYSFYFKRAPKFMPEKAEANNIPKLFWNKLQKGEVIEHKGRILTPDMVLGQDRRGIKICIITDTRPVDTIPEFISDSDLFICEGTYGSNEDIEKAIKNKHMTFQEASELAKKGHVKELLLTHFSPAIEDPELCLQNATNIFGNTVIGYDGLTKTISYSE